MAPIWRLLCLAGVLWATEASRCQTYSSFTLPDPTPGIGVGFGASVAINGDYAFVSESEETGLFSVGRLPHRVHVFDRWEGGSNGWGWVQTIEAPDGDNISFGSAIHAWGEWLAIYRGPHTYDLLGATVCRDRSVFFFKRDSVDGWVLDESLGGAFLSNDVCFFALEQMATGVSMDGDENNLIVGTPIQNGAAGLNSTLEVYRRSAIDEWDHNYTINMAWNVPNNHSCVSNEQLFHYLEDGAIEVNTIEGVPVDTSASGVNYPIGNTASFDAENDLMVTAQPTFESMGVARGRILTWQLTSSGLTLCGILSEPETHWFGQSVMLKGNKLYVLAGNDTNKVLIYTRSIYDDCNWLLANTVQVGSTISYGNGYYSSATISADVYSNIIASNEISGAPIEHPYVVSIHNPTSIVSIGQSDELQDIDFHRNESTIHICSSSMNDLSLNVVHIHDMSGRMLASASGLQACERGIDLSHLRRGIYLVEVRMRDTRIVAKIQW